MFITLEGIEGSGKTTQVPAIADFLENRGLRCLRTREPGGTPIGRAVRAVLLDPDHRDMAPGAELFLYMADRAQHVHARILPALAAGRTVICDRYLDATVVYQGYARGLGADRVRQLYRMVIGDLRPDLTLLFDLPAASGLKRAWRQIESGERSGQEIRFEEEALEFHEKIREGYLRLARQEPDRFRIIDAGRAGNVSGGRSSGCYPKRLTAVEPKRYRKGTLIFMNHSILDAIGNTPLVEIRNLNPNPAVSILAKLEYFNPGGSIKDRAARCMIEAGEKSGELTPGKTVIEATSGNTGIGLALVCSVKGYRLLLAMSEAASIERQKILKARGAEILLTPGHLGTDGAIDEVYRRVRENPGKYFMADQYNNPANWQAHYQGTAPEVWQQTDGKITMLVSTLGTSGTVMGMSRRLKEYNPSIRICRCGALSRP